MGEIIFIRRPAVYVYLGAVIILSPECRFPFDIHHLPSLNRTGTQFLQPQFSLSALLFKQTCKTYNEGCSSPEQNTPWRTHYWWFFYYVMNKKHRVLQLSPRPVKPSKNPYIPSSASHRPPSPALKKNSGGSQHIRFITNNTCPSRQPWQCINQMKSAVIVNIAFVLWSVKAPAEDKSTNNMQTQVYSAASWPFGKHPNTYRYTPLQNDRPTQTGNWKKKPHTSVFWSNEE